MSCILCRNLIIFKKVFSFSFKANKEAVTSFTDEETGTQRD